MLIQKQLQHALRRLCSPYPLTPSSPLPGYLRAFSADPFSFPSNSETASSPDPSLDEAAKAHAHLVSTLMQAVVNRATTGHHMPVHEGLQQLKEQQLAAAEAANKTDIAQVPHISRALAAITYHQRMMDGTPKGNQLQADWQRQIILETRAVEAATARYKRDVESAINRGAGATLPAARHMLMQWFPTLSDAIYKEQCSIAVGEKGMDRNVYGPYLLRLDPDQLAVITMHCALNAFMNPESSGDAVGAAPGTTRMTKVAVSIGRSVETQYVVKRLQEETHRINRRKEHVRGIYAQGQALQEKLATEGRLDSSEWTEWYQLGDRLRAEGELLPLDPMRWFQDHSLSGRLKVMASIAASGENMKHDSKAHAALMTRAKRLVQGDEDMEWPADVQAKVGVILIKMLIDSCYIDTKIDGKLTTVPAFWHKLAQGPDYKSRGAWKKFGLLYAHEDVIRRIKPHQMAEAFMPQFLPMVVPPVPWQRHNLGGHLTLRSSVMRMRGTRAQRERLEQADKEMVDGKGMGLSQVYDALNALGSTAWTINSSVHQVVEALWAWGGGICDVPTRTNLEVPKAVYGGFRMHMNPEGGQMQIYAVPKSEVRRRQMEVSRTKKKNNELHSLRCDMEYKLQIAREFLNEPRFYFPHNVDFRGRAYPMHPHLNHLGSDLCRGLLQFADAKPLGPYGLKWLYIQAANLWGNGVDKLPLEGRVKWAEDNLGTILDNASDPFRQPITSTSSAIDSSSTSSLSQFGENDPNNNDSTQQDMASMFETLEQAKGRALLRGLLQEEAEGNKLTPFWYKAESPFQFLATCFEIHGALASADPPSYKSRLPIHQDGSCNGLQHYAALGRDLTGGWAVNLCPTERPQDVYTEISNLVQRRVAADAEAGVPEAALLQSSTEVDRKLVKQTVMTSVYGVTFVGARTQIGNRLRERGFEDSVAMYKVSCYAARVTLDCLHEMFQSAKHIMQWLSECARMVAKEGKSMEWTTPLGLPVVQPYRRKTKQHVRTVLQRLVLVESHDDLPVMKQRQRTAFPPNYIHSIDSSHMMLTAIACKAAGLDFAGVHDSFWTHAGTVDQMNVILRDQFIDLHAQPLLEDLLQELNTQFPGVNFPPLPPKGDLNLEDIHGATYFFS